MKEKDTHKRTVKGISEKTVTKNKNLEAGE
jgi:hypothetical protein